jgi:hypothetical protein
MKPASEPNRSNLGIYRVMFQIILTTLACVTMVAPSFAQMFAEVPDARVMSYRVTDPATNEELSEYRVWPGTDGAQRVLWREDRFPDGSDSLTECIEGHGHEQPATAWRRVSFAKTGKLTGAVFQISDPNLYPFLPRPLPPLGLEPFACFKGSLIDKAAIESGEETSTYAWLSDNFYLRLIFEPEGRETIEVPAGSFDSIRIKIKLDTRPLFPRMPGLLVRLLSAVAGPRITLWIASEAPHQLIRLEVSGVSTSGHQNSVTELMSSEFAPTARPAKFESLHVASELPDDPARTTMNSGIASLGDATARVTMEQAHTSDGDLMIVRATFEGTIVEARALENFPELMPTRLIEQRIYTKEGALVERLVAYLDRQNRTLHSDVYPNSMVLALILPRFSEIAQTNFHVVGFGQTTTNFGQAEHEVSMWRDGISTVDVGGVPTQAFHMKLRPVVNVSSFLRPIVRLGTPTFDIYLDTSPPHRMLEFDGPFGLLGSSEIHLVADPLLQN